MVSELDKDNNLVWIDLEMTGLEDEHLIIEIATIVTNGDLEEVAEGPSIAIKRSAQEMQNIINLEEFCAPSDAKHCNSRGMCAPSFVKHCNSRGF